MFLKFTMNSASVAEFMNSEVFPYECTGPKTKVDSGIVVMRYNGYLIPQEVEQIAAKAAEKFKGTFEAISEGEYKSLRDIHYADIRRLVIELVLAVNGLKPLLNMWFNNPDVLKIHRIYGSELEASFFEIMVKHGTQGSFIEDIQKNSNVRKLKIHVGEPAPQLLQGKEV